MQLLKYLKWHTWVTSHFCWTALFQSTAISVPWGCHDSTPQTGGFKRQKGSLFLLLWGQRSESRCQQHWFLLEGSEEGSVPCLSPSFQWSLTIFGISCLVDALLRYLLLLSCGFFLVRFCVFSNDTSPIGHRTRPTPAFSHLTWLHLQRLFSNLITFQEEHEFGGHYSA